MVNADTHTSSEAQVDGETAAGVSGTLEAGVADETSATGDVEGNAALDLDFGLEIGQ
jgi:hypothetical protein